MSWLTAHLPTPVAHAAYDRITRTATRAQHGGDPRGIGQLRAAAMTVLLLDNPAASDAAAPTGDVTTTGGSDIDPVPPDQGPPDLPNPLTMLVRSVRPRVHLTVPVMTLAGQSEQSALLDGRVPIDAETARQLTARAPSLRRILTDPVTGAMVTMDRRSYVVPAHLSAFLAARDIACRFPGCGVPARRCDIDHTTDWATGGATNPDNLAHLCRAHHTLRHESRWTVEHLDHGVLAWTSPAGHTYLTEPGTADHTFDQLDHWAAQATHLMSETEPAPQPPAHDHHEDDPSPDPTSKQPARRPDQLETPPF
jgi:hypothetical protein